MNNLIHQKQHNLQKKLKYKKGQIKKIVQEILVKMYISTERKIVVCKKSKLKFSSYKKLNVQ